MNAGKCEHRFVKLGFITTKKGRKQRYRCNKCGITSYSISSLLVNR